VSDLLAVVFIIDDGFSYVAVHRELSMLLVPLDLSIVMV
jgi:tetraacyldisaccharide-1-P 4'-kinase